MKQTIVSNCTGSIRNLLRRCRNADNRRRKIQTSVAWHANTTAPPPWCAPQQKLTRRPFIWQTVTASTESHSAPAIDSTVATFCDGRLDVGLSQNSRRRQSCLPSHPPPRLCFATARQGQGHCTLAKIC